MPIVLSCNIMIRDFNDDCLIFVIMIGDFNDDCLIL